MQPVLSALEELVDRTSGHVRFEFGGLVPASAWFPVEARNCEDYIRRRVREVSYGIEIMVKGLTRSLPLLCGGPC